MNWHVLNFTFQSSHSDQPLPALTAFLLMASLITIALLKGPRTKTVRIFTLNSFFIGCWAFGIYQLTVATDAHQGLFWARLLNGLAAFIPPTFFHFATLLTETENNILTRRALVTGYCLAFFLLFLSPTPLFISGTHARPGFYFYPAPGIFFFPYMVFHMFYVFWAFERLFKNVNNASLPFAKSIPYVIVAYLFGFGGGSQTFLVGLGLSMWKYAMDMVPVSFMLILYSVLARHILDIRVVIRKTLLYSVITAGLASIYAGLVTLLARILEFKSLSSGNFHSEIIQWFGNNLYLTFASSCITAAIFSVGFGLFVLLKGAQKPVNRMWFLSCASVALWSFGMGMMVRSTDAMTANLWQKHVDYLGSIMIPIFFLHFVMLIVNEKSKVVLYGGYTAAIVLQGLNMAGHLISVRKQPPFNYYTLALPAYRIFVVYYFALVFMAHWLLFQKMFSEDKKLRNQCRYIFLGTFVGFCGGSTTFFPVYNIPIFPFGDFAVPLYILTVSYAIFKHQLMEINVVIRKTLLYSLVSASLAAIYVGTITLLAYALQGRQGQVSAYSSALAAVLITLLFNPLRRRVQIFIDRYFFRESLDQAILREATSGFVHEIKRPLAKISLPAELSVMDIQDVINGRRSSEEALPKVLERLQFILDQTSDAGHKIEAIQEVSTHDNKPREDVDITAVIKRGVEMERKLLDRHHIQIHLDFPDNFPSLRGRPKQLEIVISNLIKNAAEALSTMPPEATREIWITLSSGAGHIVLTVKDSGPGIKPENHKRLFEPYFTTKGAHGTGMGLFLCRQIVQAHGGTIEVRGEPGIGAEFIIRFVAGSNR